MDELSITLDQLQPSGIELPPGDPRMQDRAVEGEGSNSEQSVGEVTQPQAQVPEDEDVIALLAGGVDNSAEVAALKQQMAQLQQQLQQAQMKVEGPLELISEGEFEEILQDRTRLNTKLNELYQKAVETAIGKSQAQFTAQIQQQMAMQQMANQFYIDNPDLATHRQTVQQVTEKLIRQNPNLTYEQLLLKAAQATRVLKKLPAPAASRKPVTGTPAPAGVKSRAGSTAASPAKTDLEAGIDLMLKNVGD